jgi:hypothetical protein
MSIENVTYAFQVAATTGVGVNQFFSEPRFTTFRIAGNGSVSAGQVTIAMLPTKDAHDSGSVVSRRDGLDNSNDHCGSRECDNRMVRRERIWYFPRTDQHARNWRNCDRPGDPPRRAMRLEPPPTVASSPG